MVEDWASTTEVINMQRQILTPDELSTALSTLAGWTAVSTEIGSDRISGILTKRYSFPNFAEALEFVNRVGALAEAADHHPDITFGWGYAELELTTHDRGGVTDVDIALALAIDKLDPQE